jgi:ketosteroid isomerase-like protein
VSQRNVELVRASFEAFGRGDFKAAFAAYDPAAEWRTADDEPDSRTYRGLADLRSGDWVVAPWSGRLHGHGSGIEIEVSETYAVLVRDGRILRVDEYRTVEEALDAVERPPT